MITLRGGGIQYRIGDGLSGARDVAGIDHIITDPPYTPHVQGGGKMRAVNSAAARARTGEISTSVGVDFEPLDVDGPARIVAALGGTYRRWGAFFCALEQLGDYQRAEGADRWIKSALYLKQRALPQLSGDRPGSMAEGIALRHGSGERLRWHGRGRSGALVAMPENRRDTHHPTAKPLVLMLQVIEALTDPGDLVVDPFAGTGATLIACEILGRRAIGFELDPAHAAGFLARRSEALARAPALLSKARALFARAPLQSLDEKEADES